MEGNNRELSQCLTDFIANLQVPEAGIGQTAAGGQEPPHVELVDFDELKVMMRKAAAELKVAQDRAREREVVRKWFISRITSLSRGRQAVLSRDHFEIDKASLNDATLPELLHRFEEESGRLRRTAVDNRSKRAYRAFRRADDFREFKS